MRVVFLLPVLLLFFVAACQAPDSPEKVVRKWQAHIDNNEFDKAKALSSPRTEQLLSWMEALLSDMEADSAITHTNFVDLTCRENGDKAVCHYGLEAEGQLFRDSFLLVRVEGKWLIDLPEEPAYEEDADVEELFEVLSQDSVDI